MALIKNIDFVKDLDKRSKTHFLVFNLPHDADYSISAYKTKIIDFFKSYTFRYYLIVHHDEINEDGEKEREHIHALIELSSVKRGSTLLNDLEKGLQVKNETISVAVPLNMTKCLRYLTHLDDPSKKRYEKTAVFTNDFSRYEDYINFCCKTALTTQKLIDICQTSTSLLEVFCKIDSIDNNARYLNLIRAVWQEVHDYARAGNRESRLLVGDTNANDEALDKYSNNNNN